MGYFGVQVVMSAAAVVLSSLIINRAKVGFTDE